jgi:hypothetical protein
MNERGRRKRGGEKRGDRRERREGYLKEISEVLIIFLHFVYNPKSFSKVAHVIRINLKKSSHL